MVPYRRGGEKSGKRMRQRGKRMASVQNLLTQNLPPEALGEGSARDRKQPEKVQREDYEGSSPDEMVMSNGSA